MEGASDAAFILEMLGCIRRLHESKPTNWNSLQCGAIGCQQMFTQEDAAHEFRHNLLVPGVQTTIFIVIELELLSFFKPLEPIGIILVLVHVLLVSLLQYI